MVVEKVKSSPATDIWGFMGITKPEPPVFDAPPDPFDMGGAYDAPMDSAVTAITDPGPAYDFGVPDMVGFDDVQPQDWPEHSVWDEKETGGIPDRAWNMLDFPHGGAGFGGALLPILLLAGLMLFASMK